MVVRDLVHGSYIVQITLVVAAVVGWYLGSGSRVHQPWGSAVVRVLHAMLGVGLATACCDPCYLDGVYLLWWGGGVWLVVVYWGGGA